MKGMFNKLQTFKTAVISGLSIFLLWSCDYSADTSTKKQPLYDATVDTVFDIIRDSDESSFLCLVYAGRGDRQIWDKRVNDEPIVETFLFKARYRDAKDIEIAVNSEFGSREVAAAEAATYVVALGQIPSVLRSGIDIFSIHKGHEGFHAGSGKIVVYAETARDLIDANHLEESIFHEAVHASWDNRHRNSAGWLSAQQADGRFMTRYGQSNPDQEDLAESALFAYGIIHYLDRIPPADTKDITAAIPARIRYIEKLLSNKGVTLFERSAGPEPVCEE